MHWTEIATHDDTQIKGFFGDYRFLSNFHLCDVFYMGVKYPSSEHAYQAAKFPECERLRLVSILPSEVKKAGREGSQYSAEEWDKLKDLIMTRIVVEKFLSNPDLSKMLLDTGAKYLEETNYWGDTYWGVDVSRGGLNKLGKILMNVRRLLK